MENLITSQNPENQTNETIADDNVSSQPQITNPTPPLTETSPKKSKAGLWIAIVLVLMAIGGGVAYYFLNSNNKSASDLFIASSEWYSIDQKLAIIEVNAERNKEIKTLGYLKYAEKLIVGAEGTILLPNGKTAIHFPYNGNENAFVIIDNSQQLISSADYESFKSIFISPVTRKLPYYYQAYIYKIFIDNNYTTEGTYFFPKIEDRIKETLAEGDFDADGNKDLAFLLESNDFQTSMLFIIGYNKLNDQKECKLIYSKSLEYLPLVKLVKKGTRINKESTEFSPLDIDGVLLKAKHLTVIIAYSKESKNFEEYVQYTPEEIMEIESYREGEEIVTAEESTETKEPPTSVSDNSSSTNDELSK